MTPARPNRAEWLADGLLRRPSLEATVDVPNNRGLSDHLSGAITSRRRYGYYASDTSAQGGSGRSPKDPVAADR